jgi:hypothetical protein
MKLFTEFRSDLNESFDNILPDDHDKREKHTPALFNMVHKAYADQGGIHGSGFGSHEDMKKNIPMIKMNKKHGEINAAAFYKDKGGRKRVAVATNGSDEGKHALAKIMKADLTQHRSYGETSGKSISFLHKHLHAADIKSFAIHPDIIKKANPEDHFRDVPHNDPHVAKFPHLKDHFYQRKIGNDWHTKISIGSMGHEIT